MHRTLWSENLKTT